MFVSLHFVLVVAERNDRRNKMTSLSNDNDVNDDDIDDNDDVNVNDVCQHFGKRRLKDFAAIRSSEEIKVLSQKVFQVWRKILLHIETNRRAPTKKVLT